MHYKDGTPAKAGDLVIQEELYGTPPAAPIDGQLLGILMGANPQSETCNGQLSPFATRKRSALGWGPWMPVADTGGGWTVTLNKCYKIEVGEGTPPPTTGGPGGNHP